MKKLLFPVTLILLFLTTNSFAQSKVVDETFWVGGVCGMCEDRIEKALDLKGIKMADYDHEKQELHVVYKTSKITRQQIDKALNAVGHDTATSKASDEQYNGIHGCCKYRDPNAKSCESGDDHDHDDEDEDDHED